MESLYDIKKLNLAKNRLNKLFENPDYISGFKLVNEELERLEQESNFTKLELVAEGEKYIFRENFQGKRDENGIREYRKKEAEKRFIFGLLTYRKGLPDYFHKIQLIQSLLLDKETAEFKASLLEGYESVNQIISTLHFLEKDLGITGNELDEFFAAEIGG